MSTSQLILQKARELFLKRGIRSVSMDEIAIQLGISKKTLYQHFDNKEDLVVRAIEQHLEDDKAKLQELHQEADNAIDEMIRFFKWVSATLREFNPVSIYDLQRSYQKAWNIYLEYRQNFLNKLIKDNLTAGMQEGLYRNDLNIEIVSLIYMNGMDNLTDESKFPLMQYGLIPLYREFIRYHMHGIVSSKGLEYLEKRNYA